MHAGRRDLLRDVLAVVLGLGEIIVHRAIIVARWVARTDFLDLHAASCHNEQGGRWVNKGWWVGGKDVALPILCEQRSQDRKGEQQTPNNSDRPQHSYWVKFCRDSAGMLP